MFLSYVESGLPFRSSYCIIMTQFLFLAYCVLIFCSFTKYLVLSPSSSPKEKKIHKHSQDSPVAQCVARGAPICSNAYGGWFAPRAHHSMRMTYRPIPALRLLGSLRISHNKFLRANKWILNPYPYR